MADDDAPPCDGDGDSGGVDGVYDPDGQPARETTQTDHLNRRLLQAFLANMDHLPVPRTEGRVWSGPADEDNDGAASEHAVANGAR